jgi:hypothetical protein
MKRLFDHEKLEVYQLSLSFIAWLEPVLERLRSEIRANARGVRREPQFASPARYAILSLGSTVMIRCPILVSQSK